MKFQKYFFLFIFFQILLGISKAQSVQHEQQEDEEMEHNEGTMALRYWEDLEKQIQQKNTENGVTGLDRKAARFNEFKNRQANAQREAAITGTVSGSWTQVSESPSNVGMGRIEDIAFDDSNPNIFYIATSGGGVWKTTNGGASYLPRTDGLPAGGISSIVIDPNNNNILYIFAGGGLGSNDYPGTVYKSTDAGFTWLQTGFFNMPDVGYELKIHPTNSNILFLATNYGLYKSINAGGAWNIVLTGSGVDNTAIFDMEFKPGDPSVMYAVGRRNVYISLTNGNANGWTSNIMPAPPTGVLNYLASRLAVSAAAPNDVFVAMGINSSTIASNANGTVFYVKGTHSNVTNFINFNTPLKIAACTRLCYRSGGGRSYGDIYVSATNSSNVMVGGIDNFTTFDAGVTWVLKSKDCFDLSKNIHDDVGKIRSAWGKFFVTTDGGLFSQVENYTVSAAAWTDLSAGIEITQLYTHAATPLDPERYMYANQDNSCQVRKSASDYNNFLGGDGTSCKIYKGNKELYYGSIQSGEFMTRHNLDFTKTYITPNLSNVINGYDQADTGKYTGSFNYSKAFGISENNSTDIYAVKESLYISADRGDNWVRFAITNATTTHNILRVAQSNSNRIYVVEDNTNVFQRSDNGGATWTDITATKPYNGVISDLVISGVNSLDIYVTFYGNTAGAKVYHSTNGGASWANISAGLPNVDTRCITLVGNAENSMYLGNDFGVYYRDNNLGHWIDFSNGLPVVYANNIVYDIINAKLSVATYGHGIWVTPAYDAASCVTNRTLTSTYYYRNVYTASNDINSTGTVYGDANSTIKFSAGHQVILQPGFVAQKNADFTASLEGCSPSPFAARTEEGDTSNLNVEKIMKLYNVQNKWKNTEPVSPKKEKSDSGELQKD